MIKENKPKIGQLCWGFHEKEMKRKSWVGVLTAFLEDGTHQFNHAETYRYITPLTKSEINQFMELANDENS